MVPELHVSLEHGTAEVQARAPAPSVRCFTVARARSLVLTPTVFQVLPVDCVDQWLGSPLASLKNAVRVRTFRR